ncbi:choline/glycine/proline betaine transport protein [Nocardioides cavernae]|uniref:Choline/glycine/proline betaine transport protein n=1 Tax=Nocardioides cavernae TaxID=1921566 RepID=A0A7Y9H304_9ACTN|nr:choline BCCT transporter BetT [Nocardioides cavernae]NYE37013.1 choline/glycine/proline betaine transport protein [Nocardioides cavernae]
MTAQTDAPAPPDPLTSGTPGPKVRWPVFVTSFVGVCVVTLWAIVAPTSAESVIGDLVTRIGTGFGWFYVALATVIVGFVVFLGCSRFGSIRLGPDHARPEFSTFAWASMLFAAGIGTDVMFYSVIEPVSHYTAPPVGEPGTVEAARDATVWTLFHYGVTGWAMYALMGLALAYFSYRKGLPLAVRSALHPVFGRRVEGALGHAVDTAAVLGTIFGVATSLGIGVVFLNVGLNVIFGVPVGTATQAALAIVAVTVAAVSATSGVDRGIRFLSQLNVLLALGLAGWVLVTGKTAFLLNAVVMNVGDFARSFPAKTLETFAFTDTQDWMQLWTLFFWAWWVAWASFVGQFLARISRGRTIRQFVLGTMVIPFSYIVMWISIFGNAAIDKVRNGDDSGFADRAVDFTGVGFYELLQDYPLADVVIFVAFLVGLLFYITSADSAALVMGNLCSELQDVQQDCAAWLRISWASATGLLTVAMLAVGGIATLQYATIIMGLPFAFVLVLVMWGLFRSLRDEGRKADAGVRGIAPLLSARTGSGADNRKAWKARLARATNFVDDESAAAYLASTIEPALSEVAGELTSMGVPAGVRRGGAVGAEVAPFVELVTEVGDEPFVYRVVVRRSPVPTYGGRMIGNRDQYARLEVHLAEGGQDHDVMGYTADQVIHDCLDQYERHLEFLRSG